MVMKSGDSYHCHDHICLVSATNSSWGRHDKPPLVLEKRHAGAGLEEQDHPPRVCLQPSPELTDVGVVVAAGFKGPRGMAWAAVVLREVAMARSQRKEWVMVNSFVSVISPWLIGPSASNTRADEAVSDSKGGCDLSH